MIIGIKSAAAVATIALLAGCMGGGGETRPSFAELDTEYDRLQAIVPYGELSAMYAPEDLPEGGEATYNGALSIYVYSDAPVAANIELLGELTLVAGFSGDGTITGGVNNFSDSIGTTFTGGLEMASGAIYPDSDPDTFAFSAFLDGSITSVPQDDDAPFDLEFFTTILGDFYGPNYEYVGGTMRGTITAPGGTLEINDGVDQDGFVTSDTDGDGFFFGER